LLISDTDLVSLHNIPLIHTANHWKPFLWKKVFTVIIIYQAVYMTQIETFFSPYLQCKVMHLTEKLLLGPNAEYLLHFLKRIPTIPDPILLLFGTISIYFD